MKQILLIDDDESFLRIYAEILKTAGYHVETASSGAEALSMMEEHFFHIAISDVAMPQMNGMDLLRQIRTEYPEVLVMMLTGEGSISGAVEAMELGAYTYLIKPLEIDQLLLNIKRAVEFLDLNSENIQLKNQLSNIEQSPLLGNSTSIKSLREQIVQIAPTSASVLITGESGTGKEIIANLLHENSLNKGGPMIKVNCAALAESVLESELFGHEKGAFTGAIASTQGRFEMARGGTLFLDEIGEMSVKLQSKLLRVLQEKEFERVGGSKTIKVDFRLISATNRDLRMEVEQGNFREDLYYRINVIPLKSSPLRERVDDIPLLLEHYMRYYCKEMKRPPVKFSEDSLEVLKKYQWRGNVRELKNLVERLMVFSNGQEISMEMLPEEIKGENVWGGDLYHMSFQDAKHFFEKQYLEKVLEKNNWNISLTAEEIKLARKNLQLKIKQLEIKKGATEM